MNNESNFNLVDMANGKIPIPVGLINVRSSQYADDPEIKPRLRRLKSVEWRKPKKEDAKRSKLRWLYWTWEPNSTDGYDCGYAGMREDVEGLATFYLTMP